MDKYTKEIFFGKRAALVAGDAAMKEQIAEGKDIMSILCKSEFSSNCQLVALISWTVVRENITASDKDKLSEAELLGQMS